MFCSLYPTSAANLMYCTIMVKQCALCRPDVCDDECDKDSGRYDDNYDKDNDNDDNKNDSILLCSPWRALCRPDVCGVMGSYITHSACLSLISFIVMIMTIM